MLHDLVGRLGRKEFQPCFGIQDGHVRAIIEE
jgi:hypothetical protein